MSRVYYLTQPSDLALRAEQPRDRFFTRLRFVGFALASFLFDRSESSF